MQIIINKSKAINNGDTMEIECTLEFIEQRCFTHIMKEKFKD